MKPETIEEARAVLKLSGFVFNREGDEPQDGDEIFINLNDTWGWAYACCQKIEDSELIEVAELFRMYGYCGLLYWAGNKQEVIRSEFHDITRFMEFVRNEEAIRKEVPDSNRRAYASREYTLGTIPRQSPPGPEESLVQTKKELQPFVSIANGIPDNWPGNCILKFDQREDGSIYIGYHGVNDAKDGITIDEWRALLTNF